MIIRDTFFLRFLHLRDVDVVTPWWISVRKTPTTNLKIWWKCIAKKGLRHLQSRGSRYQRNALSSMINSAVTILGWNCKALEIEFAGFPVSSWWWVVIVLLPARINHGSPMTVRVSHIIHRHYFCARLEGTGLPFDATLWTCYHCKIRYFSTKRFLQYF